MEISRLDKNTRDEIRILTEERNKKISDLLIGKSVSAQVKSRSGEKLLDKGENITLPALQALTRQEILRLPVTDKRVVDAVEIIYRKTDSYIEILHKVNEGRIELLQKLSDPPATTCPNCGGGLRKQVSAPAFQFKGSGWYLTDYAQKSGGADGGSAKPEGGSAKKESGSSAPSEAKTPTAASGAEKGGSSSSSGDSGGAAKAPAAKAGE